MGQFIDLLWDVILSSKSGFAGGVAFVILFLIYAVSQVYRVFSTFIRDLLGLSIARRRHLDLIQAEKERNEVELQRLALESLRKTGDYVKKDTK